MDDVNCIIHNFKNKIILSDKRGFSLIEVMMSIVFIGLVTYGLSSIPIELVYLKNSIVSEYTTDVTFVKLKSFIDKKTMYGGIITDGNTLQIGDTKYLLEDIGQDKYTFKVDGIDTNVIYTGNKDKSYFYLEGEPERKLKYNNTFSSFEIYKKEVIE